MPDCFKKAVLEGIPIASHHGKIEKALRAAVRYDFFALSLEPAFIALIKRLLHGGPARRSLPPRDTFAVRCHRTAAIVKPDRGFTSLAVFLAIFKSYFFGFFLVCPAVRITVGATLPAVGDRTIDFGAAAWTAIKTIR